DLIFGKIYNFAATFVCFHPVYGKSWLCAFDLKHDPRPLFDLGFSELKQALFSTPTKIRQISLNKMPVVLSKENFSALEDYKEIGMEEILKRSKLVKDNHDFSSKVHDIIEEKVREKQDSASQDEDDHFPEHSIHQSSIQMSRQDRILLPQFQKGNWEEKAKTYKSFQDSVLQYFGKLLIYEEQPDALSKEELSSIKKVIAEKLLTTNQRPWITFPDAFKKIDDLRQEKNADQKFLKDYDLFLQDLQAKHEQNI
ncbi:MAG TPA: hypothetical protein EYO89_00580, partial [Candidatus Dadabacteria bacterium]|nr:hypothetical protein [Candidatus Dadabacteria bacterium]